MISVKRMLERMEFSTIDTVLQYHSHSYRRINSLEWYTVAERDVHHLLRRPKLSIVRQFWAH